MKINDISLRFGAKKIDYTTALKINQRLLSGKSVDIVCHEKSDDDAVNSALSMYEYLKQKGVETRVIISKNINELNPINQKEGLILDKDFCEVKPKDKTILCVDFSSKKRVANNVQEYIENADDVLCLDHHKDPDVSDYYIDTSAKSATSIVYRLFESLGEEVTNEQAYRLLTGFISDCSKKSLLICDSKHGTIKLSEQLKNDKNAYEIYLNLIKRLNSKQIAEIIKKEDKMSNLTLEQQEFSDSLNDKLRFSKNKKVAYVVIPPDDEIWQKLGSDNAVTSKIINIFRQKVLRENKDVKTAIVFYQSNDNYRLSAHSKDNSLLKYFDYIMQNCNFDVPLSMGGHPDRAGGKLETLDKNICYQWIDKVIEYSNFYD